MKRITHDMSKADEIQVMDDLRNAFTGSENYLEHFFTPHLCQWVENKIKADINPDVMEWLDNEWDKHVAEMQVKGLKNTIDHQKSLVDTLYTEIAELKTEVKQEQSVSADRLTMCTQQDTMIIEMQDQIDLRDEELAKLKARLYDFEHGRV
jgi:hypothetical protein